MSASTLMGTTGPHHIFTSGKKYKVQGNGNMETLQRKQV